jgi:signal transduction histidine kinase
MAFEFESYERKLATARDEKIYLEKIAQSNKRIIQITTIAIILLLLIILLMYISYRNVKRTNELRYTNKKLEEAKSKAEQLTKLKSDFISNVSHELRTPLYGITGITSILLQDKESFSKHKDVLGALKFSSDHLLNLVNNVLKLGKIESQETEGECRIATNLRELITSITITVDALVRERGNHIDVNISPEIKEVFYKIDGSKLSEILYNLINNAVKFTNCGVITVEAHKTSSSIGSHNTPFDEILFIVKDTGLGIPKEKQKIIFEAFKQVNEQENIYDGVGLGLTIIKDILQNMGSTIHLESELGEGSTFSFTLNLERSDIPQSTAQDIKDPLASKRLLLAEDNKVCQIVSSKLIKQLGHEYTMVENGEEAIIEYDKGGFDIVLMDLNMPVIDGYEASVRIIEKYPTAQIVALTATDISQVRDKCLKAGMISVLNKPLTREELEKTIQALSVE